MKPSIAFFDFDGTITNRDTLFEIIRFQKGSAALYAGLLVLSPALLLFKMKLLPTLTMKQMVLRYFFRNMPQTEFRERCAAFCSRRLPSLLRPGALKAIQEHLAQGHQVVVVTASAEDWVAPWCASIGISCLGTRLETRNGRLTGNIHGPNCNGDEKVCRIRAQFDLDVFDTIYAYGDSKGDREMLAVAGVAQFRPFRD